MSWTKPFIVYRITGEGKLEEVYHAQDMKDAKYWLSYIGEIGDVLCRTPAHPNCKSPKPTYFAHKEQSGKSAMNEEIWRTSLATSLKEDFPETQIKEL